MKRTILTAAIVIAGIGAARAQQATYFKGQSKQDVVFGLLSSDYNSDDNNATASAEPRHKHRLIRKPAVVKTKVKEQKDVMQSAAVNDPTNYVLGEDKYLKTKEENKRYSQFQVYDIKGMDKDAVVLGMLTNTLDRGIRYEEKGDIGKKITVTTGFVDELDENGNVIPGQKLAVASIRLKDKLFVIIGDHDYRYMDGKRVVGGQKLVDEMIKGKPVTELTFFYELQKAGIIDKSTSLKQFTQMDLNQKQQLLNTGNIASAD